MNRTKLKNYAPQARRDFIRMVTDRAAYFGLTPKKVEPIVEQGDAVVIAGRAHPRRVAAQRRALEERIGRDGFDRTMEALAYTWFNRLVAIRFMELHDYLENGEGGASYRVLSHPEGKATPEVLEKAEHVELPGLKRQRVIDLKLEGTKEGELYRLLLVAQCNALHDAMPFLFEKIDDETELVLPEGLLHSDSSIRKLVAGIDEEDWGEVEIIGWLYEAYISERYEEVIGKVVPSADIPAATQRFTPKWIVRYLVQNTLGRLWLATYPQSPLKGEMRYYIEPAEQAPEVQEQLREITPTSLNPEEITFLDPACGSAHILVEAYDLFRAIYQERGYRARDIPRLILGKNLFGLEIDDRAAQLAAFALMMKARADDRRIFDQKIQPQVRALVQTDGMDAEDIAAALNVSASKETAPPGQLFETEDDLFTRAASTATRPQYTSLTDVTVLVDLFQHAKTFGSLIQVPSAMAARLPQIEQRCREVAGHTSEIASRTAAIFLPVIEQTRMLAGSYDLVLANPPYMGSKYYDSTLKVFINKQYQDAKADLYACFIRRNSDFVAPNGFVGMITIPNWMFLPSFEDVRKRLLALQTIDTFIHNGRGVFGSDFGSCSFVYRNARLSGYRGTFRKLFERQGSVTSNEELEARFFITPTHSPSNTDFSQVPGSPLAYWLTKSTLDIYGSAKLLGTIAEPRVGLQTGSNEEFVRIWYEVSFKRIGLGLVDSQQAEASKKKWFPYNKGGEYRRWFGNNIWVVNWEADGKAIRANTPRSVVRNQNYYFREGVTWTTTSYGYFGVRYTDPGFLFDVKGASCFSRKDQLHTILGLLASPVSKHILDATNPTTENQVGNIKDLPVLEMDTKSQATTEHTVRIAIELAREDWDSFETSWSFQVLPALRHRAIKAHQSQEAAEKEYLGRFQRMKILEFENSRLFIEAYGLRDELSPEVPDDQITLYRPNREEDIKRLISYAIGCVMGRYSLDKPGLVYAQGGNVGFDPDQHTTFPADDDGIVPLLEADWGIPDDAASRIEQFVGAAWPGEHLEENLAFIAEALNPSRGERSRDTIRRYLATGFYKDHLRWYKRRPIYWLFSSGRRRAFQCLVYLHRYHEGTLARMRTEYVIPLQGQIAARIERLEGDKAQAPSTSRRHKLQKEQDDLKKQQAELLSFDEVLKHHADQRITLDLDDGVKVNYGKFGTLLAEVKAVTGGGGDE
ncbi:BREX-1 system adenine-specific DNA-methyltransferase PglX [Tautonia plasticadhaerens]|uniref:site-specific DNA-methyltransferase (adenine-specific) n=1 Tax=Tautonia plasticadhaerens TaxID=2527974 RepID=A0A518H9V8_9BACT|nr:BREX-1 system adenine-specific DNA-methyltransferase PglX [Tautonia plasticadhaerens]QDV37587.1 N-6 DNA Methylase [Tautonia plasticadhaerens]